MSARLRDRITVITGGAGGLGAVFAMAAAQEGASVVVADIDEARAVGTADAIVARGGNAIAVAVDTSDEANVVSLFETVGDQYGRLDVLVNNAAVMANLVRGSFLDISVSEWDEVMATNLRGYWLCAREATPYLVKSPAGRIINISSDMALSGAAGLLHYSTSKGGVLAFTRSLAREVGHLGVTVNAIAPGFTDTVAALNQSDGAREERVSARAIKRAQQPSDVVGAMLFLASDEAAMITGQTIIVNGGSHMH